MGMESGVWKRGGFCRGTELPQGGSVINGEFWAKLIHLHRKCAS